MRARFSFRAFAAALILSFAACNAFNSGPAATVQKFYRLVEKGDITEATTLVSATVTAQFGEKIKAGLAAQTREIQTKQGIKSMAVRSETVVGETAEVVVDITFGDSTTKTDKEKLIRENGQWRITADK